MLGKYKESNEYFQLADFYIEDFHKKYGLKALTYLSNPSIVPYSGENYEKILLHYYSTLNYLMLNNFDDALVECKRMLLMMENISTYYKTEHQLHRDAFTHLLLGIVYDAKKIITMRLLLIVMLTKFIKATMCHYSAQNLRFN